MIGTNSTPDIAGDLWDAIAGYATALFRTPEVLAAHAALGLDDRWLSYFGSRAAGMGAVTAPTVVATFYVFSPALVAGAIPAVWRRAGPDQIIAATYRGVEEAIAHRLGDGAETPDIVRAAGMARRAAEGARPEGRPLFAALAALPWPETPAAVLWHAARTLREYRGDGHMGVLALLGLDGCEAVLTHALAAGIDEEAARRSRGWDEDSWIQTRDRLYSRGWVDGDGRLTPPGHAARERIEEQTERLAFPPLGRLGEPGAKRLERVLRQLTDGIASPRP